jgi:periplasmic divalent cation tolerance protein
MWFSHGGSYTGLSGGMRLFRWKGYGVEMTAETLERMVFVYTTYPSLVEAQEAGRALVTARLAACVNILPGMVSIYRWNDAIEQADEVVMLIKTRASRAEEVSAAVKARHSYDTPAILVLPIESVDSTYLAWLATETSPQS